MKHGASIKNMAPDPTDEKGEQRPTSIDTQLIQAIVNAVSKVDRFTKPTDAERGEDDDLFKRIVASPKGPSTTIIRL